MYHVQVGMVYIVTRTVTYNQVQVGYDVYCTTYTVCRTATYDQVQVGTTYIVPRTLYVVQVGTAYIM